MTKEQKAAQLVFPGFSFLVPDYDNIAELVRIGIGGICLYHGSIFDAPAFINSLQRLSTILLLICSDLENGAGSQLKGATELPSNMAVGATNRQEFARFKGYVTALEARALGIRLNLAPVCDLSLNPQNPIINIRSFGDDPEQVAKAALEFIKGTHEAGVLSCAKHFPGHGSASADSHLELPVVLKTIQEMESDELKPFISVLDHVDCVMCAHVLFPKIDESCPASLSEIIIGKLLREKLGFDKIIMTDALMMGAIVEKYEEQKVIELALNAGVDILLFPGDPCAAIDYIKNKIPEERLNISVQRIINAKSKLGLFEDRFVAVDKIESSISNQNHKHVATRIAEGSITLLRNSKNIVPLKSKEVVYYSTKNQTEDIFLSRLSKKIMVLDHSEDLATPCVISVKYKPVAFSGSCKPPEEEVGHIKDLLRRYSNSVIISFGSPYVLQDFDEASTLICAFSDCEGSQTAAVRALFGEIPFAGVLPVKL